MMPSRKVAESGLRAMLRGKPRRIPGLVNAIPAFSLRFMPRRAQAALAHWTMNTG